MLPNDAETVKRTTDRVSPALAEKTLVTVAPDGTVRTGAGAVFVTAARTGGFYGIICRFLALRPVSLLFEPGYRLFARNRWRLARFFKDPEE